MAAAVNGASLPPTELASMLRKSAEIVERREFHPILFHTMRALTAYAGEYADGGASSSNSVSSGGKSSRTKDASSGAWGEKERDPPGKRKSNTSSGNAFSDVPEGILDATMGGRGPLPGSGGAAAAAVRVGAPGGQFSSAAAAASGKEANYSHHKSGKGGFSFKSIGKRIEKIGTEILGDHIPGKDSKDAREDDYAWCDEHFTRGCGCKLRKDINNANDRTNAGASNNAPESAPPQQQSQSRQAQQATTTSRTSTALSENNKSAKPCFQRPINPNSNLIANGWIDQQRRSKMRVVWKDVLASLVEGRRPGEETTLWIQRQVVDPQTGKVTGLEALHQIPMKWLEDVNYVDLYGDHRFTLKVYNIAEEFYFRTRDEQSAQSWVLTLRSARDASLENAARMTGVPAGTAAGNGEMPSAKDMGLHNLDDWDSGNRQQHGSSDGKAPSSTGSSSGQTTSDGNDNRPSPMEQPPKPVRIPIAELRAIAHGAGFDTRGMERQDLERIAASVRASSPPASAPQPANQEPMTQKQDVSMRAAAERTAHEKLEKEQAMAKEEEEARRRKLNEDRIAAENMKRQMEEEEKRMAEELAADLRRRHEEEQRQRMAEQHAAEMKRKQEEELSRRLAEQQAAEMKRKQEEDHAKRVAEQQAAEEKRRIAEQQASEERRRLAEQQATEERKKREQEEQWRRQQQQHYQQQHAQQQFHNSNQTSGGFGQGNFQQQWGHQQQQQSYQQWQQQQQQHHPHFQQQQRFPVHQQFFNQNMPQQGSYQQQQPQQHQQYNPQQQQQPQGGGAPGGALNNKYMEEKTDEEQSAATLQIKRSILINWALLPPNMNVLRPIDQLVTTIHTAMPPAYGVPAHEYFTKFTPITRDEIVLGASMGNSPDENKLKKAVRKVRVFLHPDKLPRDLSADQQFMARMLWDITSDSWEEFLKHKEELDWIRN
mmetsp:Transcript_12870/g.27928  ORF Transcript_12870/g.27928 Transcript_12870/m.27928 type:complete len:939 (-) Transcript_12870:182-2998(-)